MTLKMHREMIERLEGGKAAEIGMDQCFTFLCDQRCMGRCCHTIKILLDPWDVEAMSRYLGVDGREFVDRYCELEEDPRTGWPYVSLYHAGKGPCAFLMEDGKCMVYPARSRNCRTYPVGRAIRFLPDGSREEKFFMVEKQAFCFGYSGDRLWTLREWLEDADALRYYQRADVYFELISYAESVLQVNRWMNSRIARMIMPFLYGPEVLREKTGISPGEVSHEEFYYRRMRALRLLLAELAAGFGFGPGGGRWAEAVKDVTLMDKVSKLLLGDRAADM